MCQAEYSRSKLARHYRVEHNRNGLTNDLDDAVELLFGRHEWRANADRVKQDAGVEAIRQECFRHSLAELGIRREKLLRLFVRHNLDRCNQSQSPYIANSLLVFQSL